MRIGTDGDIQSDLVIVQRDAWTVEFAGSRHPPFIRWSLVSAMHREFIVCVENWQLVRRRDGSEEFGVLNLYERIRLGLHMPKRFDHVDGTVTFPLRDRSALVLVDPKPAVRRQDFSIAR
jgi:hypothetical protein